jgi:putative heme-binding domain-containing protein
VDSAVADGYAWLAVSRFEPPVIRIPHEPVGDAEHSKVELVRLIGTLKLQSLAEQTQALAQESNQPTSIRLAACESLALLRPQDAVAPLASILADPQAAVTSRQAVAELLGRLPQHDARAALVAQLQVAPESVQVAIATALASGKESAEQLMTEIRAGRASAALLREPTVVARLQAARVDKLDAIIEELTARLSPADNRIAKLIQTRRDKFLAGEFDAERGQAYFAKSTCAQCHKIGETGATIAPALNGIGVRGLDRLLEDIFDPNRNVDQAFRLQTIVTEGGQVVSGFGVREEGASLVLHDQTGKQQRLPLADVAERSMSPLSPMPANLSEQVPEEEFYHLLAYLLRQQTPASEPAK